MTHTLEELEAFCQAAEGRITKARQMLSDLCTGKERWRMTIPADPDRDSDFVISDGLSVAKQARDAVLELVAEVSELERRLDDRDQIARLESLYGSVLGDMGGSFAETALPELTDKVRELEARLAVYEENVRVTDKQRWGLQ